VSDHGRNNVVHVAGEEEDAGDDDGCCRTVFHTYTYRHSNTWTV